MKRIVTGIFLRGAGIRRQRTRDQENRGGRRIECMLNNPVTSCDDLPAKFGNRNKTK